MLAYRYLFPAVWLCWGLYWWISSRDVKAAARREPPLSRSLHIGPLLLAAFLFVGPRSWFPVLGGRFLPPDEGLFWAGFALLAAGLAFSVWARLHLGRNWSGIVTIKEGHELIMSGPYALARHPIYTGLLLAMAGSAIGIGQWRGLLAVALVGWALWRKLRIEERWMRERFGEAYEAYSRRVAALVPFIL
jgi:protein-S-isoprenylcysteine O-methyltransferase Ste14